jgi:hypothetical protein
MHRLDSSRRNLQKLEVAGVVLREHGKDEQTPVETIEKLRKMGINVVLA